jgi:hypothetical protein
MRHADRLVVIYPGGTVNLAKKFGTVIVGTTLIGGGLTLAAAPAMATNRCVTTSPVTVCADADFYDTHPGEAGTGVHAAASVELNVSGNSIICTGYWGAEYNIGSGLETQLGAGATTPPCGP